MKKKEARAINTKPRMALFQGREDDVTKAPILFAVGSMTVSVKQDMMENYQ
ncbi:hypothetical protein E2562_005621, partial [Oryza meyeriana var. granulata]